MEGEKEKRSKINLKGSQISTSTIESVNPFKSDICYQILGKDVSSEIRNYINKNGKSTTEFLNQLCSVISMLINAWKGKSPSTLDLDYFITNTKNSEILLSFPQILQNFRQIKEFEITKSGYKTVVEMTMICLTECNNSYNVTVPMELINMAGTYFKVTDGGSKVYILDGIKNHKIYQMKDFWEACLLWSISNSKENYDFHDERFSVETRYVKDGYMDQLVNNFLAIAMHMKEYSRSKETVLEIMNEYSTRYKLSKEKQERIRIFMDSAYGD